MQQNFHKKIVFIALFVIDPNVVCNHNDPHAEMNWSWLVNWHISFSAKCHYKGHGFLNCYIHNSDLVM